MLCFDTAKSAFYLRSKDGSKPVSTAQAMLAVKLDCYVTLEAREEVERIFSETPEPDRQDYERWFFYHSIKSRIVEWRLP
jgi:hypothetical protein